MFSWLRARTPVAVLMALIIAGISGAASVAPSPPSGQSDHCPMHKRLPVAPSPAKHNCCQPNHQLAILKEPVPQKDKDITAPALLPASEVQSPTGQSSRWSSDFFSLTSTRPPTLHLRI